MKNNYRKTIIGVILGCERAAVNSPSATVQNGLVLYIPKRKV